MNLNELLTETRYLISDTDSLSPKWSDTILTNRLNTAQLKFVGETECIKSNDASAPQSIVSGDATYPLPTGCLRLLRVAVLDSNSNWKKLIETTKEELDNISSRWEEDTSSEPTHYINEITNNDILVYPEPNFSRSSALKCEFVKLPTDLSLTTPTTEALNAQANLEIYHQSLCYYVSFLCKTDEKNIEQSKNFFALWQAGIEECQSQLASRVENRRIINIYEQARHKPLRVRTATVNPFLK